MSATNPSFDNFVDDLVNPALVDLDTEGEAGVKKRIETLSWVAKQGFKVALKEQIAVEGDPARKQKLETLAALVA